MTIQRTLILLKPDAVSRGLVGEIITRFEKIGLKLVGLKMVQATHEKAEQHYTEDLALRKGEAVRNAMISLLVSGPVVAMVLEGVEAVELVRKMIGSTEPKSAQPGTIRGDYAHISYTHADAKGIGVKNLVHASASADEAKIEIGVWFEESELIEHNPHYTSHTIEK